MQSPSRKRSLRWWVPLGILGGVCVAGVALWQMRQPDTIPPADSISAAAPLPPPKHDRSVLPQVAEAPVPSMPTAAQSQAPPAKTSIDAAPRLTTGNAPAFEVNEPETKAMAPPVKVEQQPPRTAAPTIASRVQPTPSQPTKPQQQTIAPTPEPVAAPAENAALRPVEVAVTSQPAAARETEKRFRSDPRIDLQALVWAPESAARFVVINNRLIKEGGSLDNIVVVKINPDDVLLAEGSDRWHEAFKIR
jgi:hypothetical protein